MTRDSIRGELLKGAMEYLVLAILRDGEQYGYQVAQQIQQRSIGALAPSEGSLYPALHRLEAEGCLTASWREGERGPRRRWYRITPKGGDRLATLEAEFAAFNGAVGRVVRPVGEASGA